MEMSDQNETPSGTDELLKIITKGQQIGVLKDMNVYMSIQMVHGIISSIMKWCM